MRSPLKAMAPSVTRASSMPRKPEIARSVVVLPAPLVPSSATICPVSNRERDALHRRDGALVDDFELLDREQRVCHRPAPAAGAMLERPQQEIALHAVPDADQPERLEDQEERS